MRFALTDAPGCGLDHVWVTVEKISVNQSSSASTESISYLDVGLKLEVTPEIHVDSEVTIAIDLEVSSVVKEILA